MHLFKSISIFVLSIVIIFTPTSSNEISEAGNTWVVHSGSWEHDTTKGVFTQQRSDTIGGELVLANKYWYNADGSLTVTFKFSTRMRREKTLGMVLLNSAIASWCEWYYVYVERTDTDQYLVGLSRGNPPDHTETTLQDVPLQFDFVNDKEYIFSVVHTHQDNRFVISVNNVIHISYADNEGFPRLQDGNSGYIGLYSSRRQETKFSYLGVSGTKKTVPPIVDSDQFNCVSGATAPTTTTTRSPQNAPVAPPTTKPPTGDPTKRPSLWPTKRPTDRPTPLPTTPQPTAKPTPSPTSNPLAKARFRYPLQIQSLYFSWKNPDVSGGTTLTGPLNPDLMTDGDLTTGETLTVPANERIWGVMGDTVGMVGDFSANVLVPDSGMKTWKIKVMQIAFYDDLCLGSDPKALAYFNDLSGNKIYIGQATVEDGDQHNDYITTFTAPIDAYNGDIISNGPLGFEIQSNSYCEGDIVVREFIVEGEPVPPTDSPTKKPTKIPTKAPSTAKPTEIPTCPPIPSGVDLCNALTIECCPTGSGDCQWVQSYLCIHEGGPDCCVVVTPNPTETPTKKPSPVPTETQKPTATPEPTTPLPTQSPTKECKGVYTWGDPHIFLMALHMDERRFDYQSLGWYWYLFPCDINDYNDYPFFIQSHHERCFDRKDNPAGCVDKSRLIINTQPQPWVIEFGTHDGDHEDALDITVGTDVFGQTDADFKNLDFEDYKKKRPKIIKYDDGAGASGELRIFEDNDDGEWIVLQLHDITFRDTQLGSKGNRGTCDGQVIDIRNRDRSIAISCPTCLRNAACGLMGKYTRGDCTRDQMYDATNECSKVLVGSDGTIYHAPPDKKYGNRVFEGFADSWHADQVKEVLEANGITISYLKDREGERVHRHDVEGRIDLSVMTADSFMGECNNNLAKIKSVNQTCKQHTVDQYKDCCEQIGLHLCHTLWETCVEDMCACTASDWSEEKCLKEVIAENMNATCSYKALFPTDSPTAAPTAAPIGAQQGSNTSNLILIVVGLVIILCVMTCIVGVLCWYKMNHNVKADVHYIQKHAGQEMVKDESEDDLDDDLEEEYDDIEPMKVQEGTDTNARALEMIVGGY